MLLRNERDIRNIRHGVGHLLTGECFGISGHVHTALRDGGEIVWPGQSGGEFTEGLDTLMRGGILEGVQVPIGLTPFLNHCPEHCAANPAVSRLEGDDRVLFRLDRTDCAIDRSQSAGRVCREVMPRACAFMLEQAGHGISLGQLTQDWAIGEGLAQESAMQSMADALNWLVSPKRQLIRLTGQADNAGPTNCNHNLLQNFASAPTRHEDGERFHRCGISDAQRNFDWSEPTVAHALREPTAVLDGRTYGHAFCDAVAALGVFNAQAQALSILEIGGGLGFFTEAFLKRTRKILGGRSQSIYALLDLAPTLLIEQRRRLIQAELPAAYVQGQAANPPLSDNVFDIVICNEVIADLPVRAISARDPSGKRKPIYAHTEATRLLRAIARLLRPGGIAIVTEYGALSEPPIPTVHLDHPEFAIHFAQLLAAARRAGLEARVTPLSSFLSVNEETVMLSATQESILCLRHALDGFASPVTYKAYDSQGWEKQYGTAAESVGLLGMHWAPFEQGTYYGPDMGQFLALILEKPA
jgi:ubiquinone/menaquinone biosynthesis C-methylase UbiE